MVKPRTERYALRKTFTITFLHFIFAFRAILSLLYSRLERVPYVYPFENTESKFLNKAIYLMLNSTVSNHISSFIKFGTYTKSHASNQNISQYKIEECPLYSKTKNI